MYVMGKFWRNCVCIWKYVILFMVQSLGKHNMIRLESVLWLPWCLNDYCLFGTPKLCEYKQRMLYAQCTSSFGSNINLCIWWSWFFSQMRKLPAIVVCCFQRCHVIDRQGLARCRRLEAQSVEGTTRDSCQEQLCPYLVVNPNSENRLVLRFLKGSSVLLFPKNRQSVLPFTKELPFRKEPGPKGQKVPLTSSVVIIIIMRSLFVS